MTLYRDAFQEEEDALSAQERAMRKQLKNVAYINEEMMQDGIYCANRIC